jgi:predicted bacteriocin transport accessory protein
MKKIGQLLLIVLSIFMLAGCGKNTTYRTITYDKYKDMVANKESFILIVGAANCSYCAMYSQYMNAVIKDYNVEVNYLDISKMSEKELGEFTSVINYGGATPTTVYIVDGEEKNTYNRINGAKDYDYIVDSFRKNGYIK